jgi:quinol monooxygenase YgiN
MIAHRVKDFEAWLKVFDEEGPAKRKENGFLDRGLARGLDNPNMVYIVFAITDKEKAKARINSAELKKIMTDAGVEGPPQFMYFSLPE